MVHPTLNSLGGEVGSTFVCGEVEMKREEREDYLICGKIIAEKLVR